MRLDAFALTLSVLATHCCALRHNGFAPHKSKSTSQAKKSKGAKTSHSIRSNFSTPESETNEALLEPVLKARPSQGPKRLHLHISRHAFSCSNAMKEFYQKGTQSAMQDPMLTECGLYRSTVAGDQLKSLGLEPDLVLSSAMMRSMETALHQYPGYEIIPVPYAGENWAGLDNIPRSLNEQKEFLSKRHNLTHFNFKWLKRKEFSGDSARVGGNFTKLLSFLADHLLSDMPQELKDKDDLDVALVSHSIFMQRLPAIKQVCGVAKVENNQVLTISLDYDPVEKTLDFYDCKKVYRGISYHKTGFCQPDFGETCEAEVHAAFPMNQSAGVFDGSSPEQLKHAQKKSCCLA